MLSIFCLNILLWKKSVRSGGHGVMLTKSKIVDDFKQSLDILSYQLRIIVTTHDKGSISSHKTIGNLDIKFGWLWPRYFEMSVCNIIQPIMENSEYYITIGEFKIINSKQTSAYYIYIRIQQRIRIHEILHIWQA